MEALAGRTLLVVEDEFFILLDLQYTLEEAGAKVVTAASVEEGLAACANGTRFHAAVLDVRLPDGEVFPVAERLSARDVPLVFHSGHADRSDIVEQFPSAIALSKPVLEGTLVAAVAQQASGS